jgi:hypothetical protein
MAKTSTATTAIYLYSCPTAQAIACVFSSSANAEKVEDLGWKDPPSN